MRAFLALPVPEPVRSHVRDVQAFLRKRDVRGKWVRPGSTHLTALFLGDVEADMAAAVAAALQEDRAALPAMTARCGVVGGFGKPPRLLFLGWEEESSGTFARLVARVREHAQAAGVSGLEKGASRAAVPHLTLVRFRGSRESAALRELVRIRRRDWEWLVHLPAPPPQTFTLDRLCLYRSTLKPTGPVYDLLETVELARRALR